MTDKKVAEEDFKVAPVEPIYKFTEEEGEETSPIHRIIGKTQETTDTFTLYDVLKYIAEAKKALADKEAEIAGLASMVKAYEDELVLIEKRLGIQKAEELFQKEMAEEAQKAVDAEAKEIMLESGNYKEKD